MAVAKWLKRLSGTSSWTAGAPSASASSMRQHRRQVAVAHVDQRGGVLGPVAAVGDDQGHRLARHAHLVAGQHRRVALRVAGGRVLGPHRQREAVEVLGQQHRHHARRRARRLGVDALDDRMSARAAHERRLEQAGHGHVADVPAAAPDQARVLAPEHPGAQRARRRRPRERRPSVVASGVRQGELAGHVGSADRPGEDDEREQERQRAPELVGQVDVRRGEHEHDAGQGDHG